MANLSQQKRDKMMEFLKTLRSEHENDDEALIAISEIENELQDKKYGLVWEKHEEAVDIQMHDNIPVFTECKEKEIDAAPNKAYNFILEGDNLHSLHLLEKALPRKIDFIYIDPPYNRGLNDFKYQDKRVGKNDGYRHSKWLSFMAERLQIAKHLLKDSGCIFISIDNNEFAQLKLLCDEIFGPDNFIGSLIWRKKSGGGQTDDYFVTEHEYIFGYRASNKFKWKDTRLEVSEDSYKYQDDKGHYNLTKLEKWGTAAHREDRLSMYFPIIDPDSNEFYPVAPDGKPGRWRVGKDRMDALVADDNVYWKKSKGKWIPYEKDYYDPEASKGKLQKSRSILYDYAETGDASDMLTEIFGEKDVFENPKPVELITFLMDHVECSTVLDFFAGSGTTGHAVMLENQRDNGNRRFILCTNNENKICEEITYERIKRVINGYSDKDGMPANLKYFRTDFVPKDSDSLTQDLQDHVAEMIELERGIKLDGKRYRLILSDEDADALEAHWDEYPDLEALYVSRDVLLTKAQQNLFENVDMYTIPDYYFRFDLQEVGEAW